VTTVGEGGGGEEVGHFWYVTPPATARPQQHPTTTRATGVKAGVTVDCGEGLVDVLADFWAAVLGYEKLVSFLLVDPRA
jgi:hypothetical protein